MTPEEIRAWNRTWERRERIKGWLQFLLFVAVIYASYLGLKAWSAHQDAIYEAEHQRQLEQLRQEEEKEKQRKHSGGGNCNATSQLDCPVGAPDFGVPQAPNQ
jgi:hypothetical protein